MTDGFAMFLVTVFLVWIVVTVILLSQVVIKLSLILAELRRTNQQPGKPPTGPPGPQGSPGQFHP